MDDLWIKNAVIVNSDTMICGSITVQDGKISKILSENQEAQAVNTIDARGHYVFPGLIDCHVHFNEPGYTWRENFSNGSQAAAVGGIAMVIDMPMLNKPAVADAAVFEQKLVHIGGKSAVDYGFWGALINTNLQNLHELDRKGALAYKCFMCDPGQDYTSLNADEISYALSILKTFDGLAGFHCEDHQIIDDLTSYKINNNRFSRLDYLQSRPVEAELKATKDVLESAKKQGARIHICHVSHPDVAELIRVAKSEGVRVTAETCLHYLIFDEQTLLQKGMLYKCSPPLRKRKDAIRLWSYVCDGTLDCICSDHSPSTRKEKEEGETGAFGAWGGLSGVQTTVQGLFDLAVHQKGESPCMIARLMSENPAKIFSVYGRKGRIAEGFDADFTIIDPEEDWEITDEELLYTNKISAFTGQRGKGRPVCTIVRGKIVSQAGQILDGSLGQLIKKVEGAFE